jgi:hypothetical protein
MKSRQKRLAVAGAVVMLATCSFIGTKSDGGLPFLVAAGLCVLVLCCLAEAFSPPSGEHKLLHRLGVGSGRGSLIGVGAWVVMMILFSVFTDTGDKFPLYVVAFSPAALAAGAVAGCVVSLISHQMRRRQA